MSTYKGFGELKVPHDLLQKLEHDIKRLENSPQDQYAAFDFFVTAEHLVDWVHPENKNDRTKLRSSSSLLRITSHIANGAKHFEAKAKHHNSVTGTEKFRVYEEGVYEPGCFYEPLLIHLEHDEAQELGLTEIDAVDLGHKVLDFWRSYV